jgi:diguanylate cyclase (GGDEF)-like protein
MAVRHGFTVLFAALALYMALPDGGAREGLYLAIGLGSAALIAARAVATDGQRAGWGLIAAGIVLMLAGNFVLETPLYAAMFASHYVALVLLLRSRLQPFPVWLTLDGILAGFTFAALASLLFDAFRGVSGHDAGTLAATLASVVADGLLLVVVLVAFAATNWRPGRVWWWVGGFLAIATAADILWVFDQRWSGLWAGSLVLAAVAAWQPAAPATRPFVGWAMASVPLGGSAIAITTLMVADRPLTHVLAGAALFSGLARATLMLRENFALLRTARHEALTDKLTELPNRRALLHDLDRAAGEHTLAYFDLDGFKDYNDAFGHSAGDALLRRLAAELAGVGRAYRLGGDEFCLLTPGAVGDDDELITRAVDALSEGTVGASHGLVVLPADAHDATEALRIADERMYARKRRRRETLTQLCQGFATLASSGRADDQRGG